MPVLDQIKEGEQGRGERRGRFPKGWSDPAAPSQRPRQSRRGRERDAVCCSFAAKNSGSAPPASPLLSSLVHATFCGLNLLAEARSMDLRVVREEAIEATTRAFRDKNVFLRGEDSD